jgi:hypothetical protein
MVTRRAGALAVAVALLAVVTSTSGQGVTGPPESWITPDNFAYDESTVYSLELNTDYEPSADFAADAYGTAQAQDQQAEAGASRRLAERAVEAGAGAQGDAQGDAATLWGMNAAGVGAAMGAGAALVMAAVVAVVRKRGGSGEVGACGTHTATAPQMGV